MKRVTVRPPRKVVRSKSKARPELRTRLGAGLSGAKNQQMFLLLAETFQALGDSTRVQIIWVLALSELCVGDLALALGMSQPAVSHHLRTLRNLKLVRVRREGRTSYYALDDEHIERLLNEGIRHVKDLMGTPE